MTNESEGYESRPRAGDVPPRMPVLFVGHGNPMNAVTENRFVAGWREVAARLPRPASILCISAHWETRGTFVVASEHPRTIHDFTGFPPELYAVQYPARGNPELAEEIADRVERASVRKDHAWGLDHGAWSVLRNMYPDASVPVIQLSLDATKPPEWHYELGRELQKLRRKGVLIVGSGNIVHNLGLVDFSRKGGFDWAVEANDKLKELILDGNHRALTGYSAGGSAILRAVPTPEHFLPLLYVLAMKEPSDEIEIFNDELELGSISMSSIVMGASGSVK
jgi:4,5-DOPA dioxygenase extradiol